MVLVRVKTLDAWNTIAAAKSIAAVDECQANGGCFEENDTNGFLFFQVLGPGMSPQGSPQGSLAHRSNPRGAADELVARAALLIDHLVRRLGPVHRQIGWIDEPKLH